MFLRCDAPFSSKRLMSLWAWLETNLACPLFHKWPVTRKMFPFDDIIMYMCVALRPQPNDGYNKLFTPNKESKQNDTVARFITIKAQVYFDNKPCSWQQCPVVSGRRIGHDWAAPQWQHKPRRTGSLIYSRHGNCSQSNLSIVFITDTDTMITGIFH